MTSEKIPKHIQEMYEKDVADWELKNGKVRYSQKYVEENNIKPFMNVVQEK